MKLFGRRSREWCIAEIESIERVISKPLTGISHPTQGGQTFRTLEEATYLLGHLNARVDELDGVKPTNPIKRVGYWGAIRW